MSIKVGTCGTFDYILHPGYIELLEFAASYGDELVVFVVSDETVLYNKKRRPFFNQLQRCQNIEDFGYGFIPLANGARNNINQILVSGIDVYVFGVDQRTTFDRILEQRLVSGGVQCIRYPYQKLYSTTELLKEIGYV